MISNRDVLVIGNTLGRIVKNIGLLLLFPIPVAVIYLEWDVIPDFLMSASVAFTVGLILQVLFHTEDEPKSRHAMVVASLVYGIGAVLAGLPLWTSGSVNTLLDAAYDGMSGWTGTGLSMVPDVDHLSHAIIFWRSFTHFIGGASVIVFSLFFLRGVSGGARLYTSEGREEKIYPSITKTAKAIFSICLFFLLLGSAALIIAGVLNGMSIGQAFFDSVTVSMTAFSTGGFTPHSQNIAYYHSMLYEIIVIALCVLGAMNFVLHFTVLTGNIAELRRNIEVITFSTTVLLLAAIAMSFLLYFSVYSDAAILFRRGFFQVLIAHTGAGLQNINPIQLSHEWPYISLFAVTVAMLLGAAAGSTSAGIKSIRIGVIIQMFIQEVKKVVLPENAVIVQKYHHLHQIVVTDRMARSALLIAAAFVILFMAGSLVTTIYGYSMNAAMFETASALGNAGLSVGITSYTMPPLLKVTHILLMWAGRLEIIAVFVLLGLVYIIFKRLTHVSTGLYKTREHQAENLIKTRPPKGLLE